MMENKKGQAAIETLVMVGISIAFILPLALLFFSSASMRGEDLSKLQAKALAQRISDESARVYYQGAWARKVVLVSLPDRILNISLNGSLVVVTLEGDRGGINQFVAQAPCNMTDARSSTGSQVQSKSLAAVRSGKYVNPGLVALVFFNDGASVNVYRVTGNLYGIS